MEASLSSLLNAQILWLTFLVIILTLSFTLGGLHSKLEGIKEARIRQLMELGSRLELDVEKAIEEIRDDGAP